MYKFEPVCDDLEEFDRFVINSPYGNFRQTSCWGQIKSLSGWIPKYYILKKDGIIKGTALIQLRKIPYTPFSLMYCCRGPILDWTDTESCQALLSGLSKIVRKNRGLCLRIDPEPNVDLQQQEKVLLDSGLIKQKNRITNWNRSLYTTRVILKKNEEQLLLQLRSKVRQNINKALNKGVSISIEPSTEDKNNFFHLMKGLESRRNSLIHSKIYYNKIYEIIVEKNIGYFIKAIYEGKIISGIITVLLGDKAWALFIANDYKYRKLMPNKILMWEAIKIANKKGCRFLDLGATQGTERFDPKNDPLDFIKQSYKPEIIYFPGYYDIKGVLYNEFRITESNILPFCLNKYYKIHRHFKVQNQQKHERE
jgi:peptidoglycan pentaglycine glycine transferase (the first glycine)